VSFFPSVQCLCGQSAGGSSNSRKSSAWGVGARHCRMPSFLTIYDVIAALEADV